MGPTLAAYLEELRSLPAEKSIEPELKHQRQEVDKKIREDQDIEAGAILEAVVEQGEGEGSPQDGDLVYIHYTIKDNEDDVLFSTRTEDGGAGYPFVFRINKGVRAPRAWEIAVKDMRAGTRKVLKVRPDYGYQHPECGQKAPEGVPVSDPLVFDITLLSWQPQNRVRTCGVDSNIHKCARQEGQGWETPRPPFEVEFECTACTLAYDGLQMSGFRYFETPAGQPLRLQLGQGLLPPGLEESLGALNRGESAVFVVPAEAMAPAPGGRCLLPAPPARTSQVELLVKLLSLVQVRDMTGNGEVLKRRVRDGRGEFPVDCALHDTTVRLHYRVRRTAGPGQPPLPWLFDSRKGDEAAPPCEFDTGCGEMPEALDMASKLMVPGEVSLVTATAPRYAYQGRSDAPEGIAPDSSVEFEVELVDFDKLGHWQNMEMADRLVQAEKIKAKANELYKQRKYEYAKARYERLLRQLDSTRDFETDEEILAILNLRLACMSNLGLCCHQMGQYVESISWCDKALRDDESNAKLFFRRGKSRSMNGDYELAAQDLVHAKHLDESNGADVDAAIADNARRQRAAGAKQKQQFKNFFDR